MDDRKELAMQTVGYFARLGKAPLTAPEREAIEEANRKMQRRIWGRDFSDAETAAHIRAWLTSDRVGWPTDGTGSIQHLRFVVHKRTHWRDGTEAEWTRFVSDYADALERKAHRATMPVTVTAYGAETFPCLTCGSPVDRQGNQCISCAIREAHTSTVWDEDEMCRECKEVAHEPASYLCYRCSEVARIERVADQ